MTSDSSLQIAKLTPPQGRNLLNRPHLLKLLEDNKHFSLTLLITHAGGGKTMLAADFVSRLAAPVAWYNLNNTDQDFTQFATYLTEAICTVAPEFGQSERGYTFATLLRQATPNLNKASGLVPTLIERMANAFVTDLNLLKESQPLPQLWLVLDDYQFAQTATNNFFLELVVRHLPPGFHLLVLARELPEDFPFAEFLVEQRAQVIGVEQLSFKLNEVEALVKQRLGVANAGQIAERLYQFTRGWAVAITLTLLTLEQLRQTPAYQDLTAEQTVLKWLEQLSAPIGHTLGLDELVNEPLFNYLASTLFHQQSPARQLFLLQTCVLDALSVERCDRLLGEAGNSREHLSVLERQHLFLSRLDSSKKLYQYHILIKTFLQLRLATQPELYRRAYHQAANLAEEEGQYVQALDFYLKADEPLEAVRLLNREALQLYEAGRLRVLNEMFGMLPANLIQSQATLIQVKGLLSQETGQFEEARQLFNLAARLYQAQNEADMAAKVLADGAFVLLPVDAYSAAKEEAGQLVDYNGDSRWAVLARSIANLILGLVDQRNSQFEQAEKRFLAAEAAFQGLGDKYRINVAMSTRAALYCIMGQFIKARSLFQRTLPYWRNTGNLAREVYAHHWLASILRRSGKYAQAITAFEENLARLQEVGYSYLEPYARQELGVCYRETGNYALAEQYLREAYAQVQIKVPLMEIEILANLGLNYWLRGEGFRAYELYEEAQELTRQYELPQGRMDILLALALTELDKQRYKLSLNHLQNLLEFLKIFPNPLFQSRALLLLAVDHFALDQQNEALQTLLQTLKLNQTFFYEPYLACEFQRSMPLLSYVAANLRGFNLSEEDSQLLVDFLAQHEIAEKESLAPSLSSLIEPAVPIESSGYRHSSPSGGQLLELRALDGGRVLKGGVELTEWGWAKARLLLFYLAENPGVTLEQLQTQLWGEGREIKANTVHTLLSELRKTLQPIQLKSKNRRYHLEPGTYYYDVQEFEQRAKALLASQDKASTEELELVLALHRCEFLDNFSGWWVEERRRQLLDLYIGVAGLLGQLYYNRRNYRQAIDSWRRILQHDLYYEEAHRSIIASYRMLGLEEAARAQQLAYEEALQELES